MPEVRLMDRTSIYYDINLCLLARLWYFILISVGVGPVLNSASAALTYPSNRQNLPMRRLLILTSLCIFNVMIYIYVYISYIFVIEMIF